MLEIEVRNEAKTLDSDGIAKVLPHRAPFCLVDRILDFEAGKWAIGRKCVTSDEPFFTGHFPGYPVMPGVLIIEALAQTGAVALLSMPEYEGKLALFGGIKNARFKRQVRPGDVLTLKAQITKIYGPLGMASGEAWVDGQVAATAEITFAVQESSL